MRNDQNGRLVTTAIMRSPERSSCSQSVQGNRRSEFTHYMTDESQAVHPRTRIPQWFRFRSVKQCYPSRGGIVLYPEAVVLEAPIIAQDNRAAVTETRADTRSATGSRAETGNLERKRRLTL